MTFIIRKQINQSQQQQRLINRILTTTTRPARTFVSITGQKLTRYYQQHSLLLLSNSRKTIISNTSFKRFKGPTSSDSFLINRYCIKSSLSTLSSAAALQRKTMTVMQNIFSDINISWKSYLLFTLSLYVTCEIIFYVLYKTIFLQKCSEQTSSIEYRDYNNIDSRHMLMKRILDRIIRTSEYNNNNKNKTGNCYKDDFRSFLQSWFIVTQQQKQQKDPNYSKGNDDLNKQITTTTTPPSCGGTSSSSSSGRSSNMCSYLLPPYSLKKSTSSSTSSTTETAVTTVSSSSSSSSSANNNTTTVAVIGGGGGAINDRSSSGMICNTEDDNEEEEDDVVIFKGEEDDAEVEQKKDDVTLRQNQKQDDDDIDDNDDEKEESTSSSFANISKDDMNSFFSWAFFSKDYKLLSNNEKNELNKMFHILKDEHNIVFTNNVQCSNNSNNDKTTATTTTKEEEMMTMIKPMRLTIDSINSKYRPLIVYIVFYCLKQIGFMFLRLNGFKRYTTATTKRTTMTTDGITTTTTTTPLKYWYRPGQIENEGRIRKKVPNSHDGHGKQEGGQGGEEDDDDDDYGVLPILFFHGIAPGSLSLYTPMLLYGLSYPSEDDEAGEQNPSRSNNNSSRRRRPRRRRRRPMYMFENPSITFHLSFQPNKYVCNEHDTIVGVIDALNKHTPNADNISVVAHSFGTCQLTWLINNNHNNSNSNNNNNNINTPQEKQRRLLKDKIKQITLLDPVSILLHESDVITNFLYSSCSKMSSLAVQSSTSSSLPPPSPSSSLPKEDEQQQEEQEEDEPKESYDKIGIVSHELFIEHYLRRHFAWYNSDLWLEDIFSSSSSSSSSSYYKPKVVVGLSEHDEILNFHKVKNEIEIFNNTNNNNSHSNNADKNNSHSNEIIELIEWKNHNHNIISNNNSSINSNASSSSSKSSSSQSNNNQHNNVYYGHGYCVSNSNTWEQINNILTKHEKEILSSVKRKKKQ